MTSSWRLFVALELPAEIVRELKRLQADLQRTVPEGIASWVRPEGIHLTLKFLGDVPLKQLDALKAALEAAARGQRRFSLHLGGLGCFPNTAHPRVLWVGVEGDLQHLSALQANVEKHIAPLGYPPEERGFSPHLTLARARRGARREEAAMLGRAAETHHVSQAILWQVEAVSLMRSQLDPHGAIYTRIHQVVLEP